MHMFFQGCIGCMDVICVKWYYQLWIIHVACSCYRIVDAHCCNLKLSAVDNTNQLIKTNKLTLMHNFVMLICNNIIDDELFSVHLILPNTISTLIT